MHAAMSPPSPTLSASSRRSSAATSTRSSRGPPPAPPQKPVHLTVRSKTSPYDAAAGAAGTATTISAAASKQNGFGGGHSHWDSQATIRGGAQPLGTSTISTLRPMNTGASAAESFFTSHTSSLRSREPSLLLPDETGIGSAGFAIASSPSAFLHQHNAHAIATATAAAIASSPARSSTFNASLTNARSPPRNINFDEDDDDSDDVEDIDSFLGDDTPHQAISSPRRATAPISPTTASQVQVIPDPASSLLSAAALKDPVMPTAQPAAPSAHMPSSPWQDQVWHDDRDGTVKPVMSVETVPLAQMFADPPNAAPLASLSPVEAPPRAPPAPPPPPPPPAPAANQHATSHEDFAHKADDAPRSVQEPNHVSQLAASARRSPEVTPQRTPSPALAQEARPAVERVVAEEAVTALPSHTQEPHNPHAVFIPPGLPARALFAFQGEPNSNELSLAAGQAFEVLDPELAPGWSLAVIRASYSGGEDRRGLVPNGWYCLIQDFKMAPPGAPGTVADSGPTSSAGPQPAQQRQASPPAPAPMPAPVHAPMPTPALANPLANLFRISRASMSAGLAYPTPIANHAIPEEEQEETTHVPQTGLISNRTETQDDDDEDDRFQAWLKGASSSQSFLHPQARKTSAALIHPDGSPRIPEEDETSAATFSSPTDSRQGTLKAGHRISEYQAGAESSHGQAGPSHVRINGPRVSDSSSSPVLIPSSSAIDVRLPALAEPVLASTSTLAASAPISSAGPSRSGYLASLLSFGGKSFNRFGPFVASGAEDWILCTEAGAGIEPPQSAESSWDHDAGDGEQEGEEGYGYNATWGRGTQRSVQDLTSLTLPSLSRSARRSKTEIAQHMVISGPAGPRWKTRSPPFHVEVHSPIKKQKLNGMHEYTLYTVTSTYPPLQLDQPSPRRQRSGSAELDGEASIDPEMEYAMPYDPTLPPQPAGHTLTVLRRFTHFAWLSRVLSTRYPALVLPPLPSKQYAGRFSTEFIETRRADLDLWLSRVVRHPIARYEEAVIFFLSEDDEAEWKRREAEFELPPKVEIVSGIGPTGAYSTIGRRGVPLALANGPVKHGLPASANGIKSVVMLEGAPTFFASTFHPDFNLDVGDSATEARSMERFADAYERAMLLEPGGGLAGGLSASGSGGSRMAPGGGGATIGMSASAIADSAGPTALPPKGYPAAGAVGVLPAWRGLRESTALTANSYRDLSFALLRLITGRGLGLADDQPPAALVQQTQHSHRGSANGVRPSDGRSQQENLWLHGPPMGGLGKRPAMGASNEEGGWCWREGCTECVALTKSLQYVAQALHHVADEHDQHTRVALMRQHERLKAIGRPRLAVDKLLDVHRSTTLKYREATGEAVEDGDGSGSRQEGAGGGMSNLTQTERELMAARCETVLNVTMSEMDRIHQERTEDWTAWGKHWLDDEIAHHERCLETLRNARAAFEPDSWEFYAREGPVLPTPHDAELYLPRRSAFPIPMPSAPYAPPGMTASAIRPVSLASEVVREGVTKFTYLFGPSSPAMADSQRAAAA